MWKTNFENIIKCEYTANFSYSCEINNLSEVETPKYSLPLRTILLLHMPHWLVVWYHCALFATVSVCAAQSASTALHAATTVRYTVRVPPRPNIWPTRWQQQQEGDGAAGEEQQRCVGSVQRDPRWALMLPLPPTLPPTLLLQPARCACAVRCSISFVSR